MSSRLRAVWAGLALAMVGVVGPALAQETIPPPPPPPSFPAPPETTVPTTSAPVTTAAPVTTTTRPRAATSRTTRPAITTTLPVETTTSSSMPIATTTTTTPLPIVRTRLVDKEVTPGWLVGVAVVSGLINLAVLGAYLNRRYRHE